MITQPHRVVQQAADCSSTGDKIAYTVPAGMHAEVTGFGCIENAGIATVDIQWTPSGGTAITLDSNTVSDVAFLSGERISLSAGDKIAWNCTTAEASGDWDLWISLLLYAP